MAAALPPGVVYTNYQIAEGPWSIHVVQVQRTNATYGIHLRHAGEGVLGLSTLRTQITDATAVVGEPVAAINGGFYQRDKVYAGAARGLQVREGELLSAPSGSATFWIDVLGEPHLEEVASQFEITWPDGRRTPFGLNGDRGTNRVALYTPAIGASTLTTNGRELVLERQATGRWLPLRIGQMYSARVREIRDGGNTQLAQDVLVLSLSPEVMGKFPNIKTGDLLSIATAASPAVRGVRTALSGGPALVRAGKRLKIATPAAESYEFSSMIERHPRSAIGWNNHWYFLVVVDGRHPDVSDGMTLDELSAYLVKLGCREALNLDGGGSSTLWCAGDVRNRPCDGYERTLANSLVVTRQKSKTEKAPARITETENLETRKTPN